jgi:hypothetical protein
MPRWAAPMLPLCHPFARPLWVSSLPPSSLSSLKGFCEDLARQNTVAHLSQLQLRFRCPSHMGFSRRRGVLKATIWDAARSAWVPALIGLISTCLSVFSLFVYHLSVHHFSVHHFSVHLIG